MEYLPLIVAVTLVIIIGGFIAAKGGLRGAVFGSKVLNTVGEVHPQPRALTNYTVRVHVLEGGEVGLEISISGGLSGTMHGCVLTSDQAKRLAGFLESAS